MKRTEEGNFICPAGHEFELEKVTQDSRSKYEKINMHFRCHKCKECPMKSKCTKSKEGRTIVHNFQLEEYEKEVQKNVKSADGIKLMFQRSNETEGTFGDWKMNQKYDRMHRRGNSGVKTEIIMVAIGHNIRKYHRQKQKVSKEESN